MMMLEGKTILITGSSRGIGAAAAKLAKGYGAEVLLHGRSESRRLKRLASELEADYVVTDVRDKTTVVKAVRKFKKIDGLINSAGIVTPASFLDASDRTWLTEFEVNVLGIVHFCQAVIPVMQKQKYGRIVNVASIRGHANMVSERVMHYSVSKASVVGLTAALAKEYAPDILVNAVSPGFTKTDMAKSWNENVWRQAKSALLGRPAEPAEIAEALLFLASDKARFITGQTLIVDGGYGLAGK